MSQLVTFRLTETDQHLLLQIARNAVDSYLGGQAPRLPDVPPGVLREPRGIFVSLHQRNELRGCIGNLYALSPLYRGAAECAIAAATGDARFRPLMPSELPTVEFEMSILSPLRRVVNVREIEIGKHGLFISTRNARAVLLPQVAAACGWDPERFLQETCKKAGLKPDDWKQDVSIQAFSAVVFSEKQFHTTFLSNSGK